MKPMKSVFLKTYGKQQRRISPWMSPGVHREAFDCSTSDDSSDSVCKPAKQVNTRAKKKSRVPGGNNHRCARKKAILLLFENSSDDLDVGTTLSSSHAPVQQHHVIRDADDSKENKSPLEESSTQRSKKSHDIVPPPPYVGRFVTRRRRSAFTKPPALDSSDEFTAGRESLKGVKGRRPSKRKTKRPSLLTDSIAEIVANNTGTTGFLRRPFQETSLNQSGEHSLGSCAKKPIFCSTPSANLVGNLSGQSHNALSLSCIDLQSPFQASLGSPPLTRSAKENLNDENTSVELFDVLSTTPNLESEKGQSDDVKHVGQSVDSEGSSRFVSAADGLDWVACSLKERCLTQTCSVQLRRLDLGLVFNQSTYSSCLEYSSPITIPQSQERLSRDRKPLFHSSISLTEDETTHHGKSVVYTETCEHRGSSVASEEIDASQESEDIQATVNSSKDSVRLLVLEESLACSDSIKPLVDVIALKEKTLSTNSRVQLESLDASLGKEFQAALSCSRPHLSDAAEQMQDTDGLTSTEEDHEINGHRAKAVAEEEKESHDAQTETLADVLRVKCLTGNAVVKINRVTMSQLQEMVTQRKSSTEVSDVQARGQSPKPAGEVCTEVNLRKRSSAVPVTDQHFAKKSNKRAVPSKKPNRRNTSTNRPGTSRKACVSGMSVSRWKNKGNSRTLQKDNVKGLDNSIVELISKHHKQTLDMFKPATVFSTPVRAGGLHLSPLSRLPSDTHTWSQLKAALSVHRKGKVLLTPMALRDPIFHSPEKRGQLDVSRDIFASPFRTPLPKHLRSQLQSDDTMNGEELSDAEKVFAECNQQRPLPWEQCILPEQMKKIVKIGEGTFGEVFSTTNALGETVALKVIPVEGTEKVNGEDQKTFGEILHEIIISKELSSLKEKQKNQTHGFIGLHGLHCVKGCYPPQFLKTWDAFDRAKGSENDRPDFFGGDQLFIILQYEFGGADLENSNGKLASINMAKSILHQVTAALAVAEQELHFEHRDLHWGNILVKTTKQKKESYLLDGAAHSVDTRGVLIRIIDYSLSRLEIDDLTVSCDISNDEDLFKGWGDYQFDIYRLMRQENGNDWNLYRPHTNVLWLHYLCSKLLAMKYRSSGGRVGKEASALLTRFQSDVLQYSSATEVVKYLNSTFT